MAESLSGRKKVVGLKQTRRAIAEGRALQVYLACDADPKLTEPLAQLCTAAGVPAERGCTMAQLGKLCGIAVGTAACAAEK